MSASPVETCAQPADLTRWDLSNKLIHFVRELNLSAEGVSHSEMFPKEFGLDELVEDDVLSPFFLLRRILRKRQLLAGWSMRSDKRTIYGPFPAVCFTEMPLREFVKSGVARQQRGEKSSPYGIAFDKQQLFARGARPVIYGTSESVQTGTASNGARSLTPNVFNERELYRYVTFDLGRVPRPIDWTHEREWRWPNFAYRFVDIDGIEGDGSDELYNQREEDRIPVHGLNLDEGALSDIGHRIHRENGRTGAQSYPRHSVARG